MTTEQSIDKQLNDDYAAFYEEKYKGKLAVPKDFIELFKMAIKSMASFSHKINFNKVKSISKKTTDELKIGDLHEIIKVVLNTNLKSLYPTIQISDDSYFEVIDKCIKIEKFVIEYNAMVEDFTQKLQMKKKTLQDLSGRNNGMRIIPQA